ncbi:hypothetical protein EBT16_01740 [bacterium]|nr:hypothetical protein [bacterium]
MSTKAIHTDFVLSTNALNEYGFKLLTDGCDLGEFKKNPVGFHNHDSTHGVLVRWENVRIEGDKVLAQPAINLSHPRGARTEEEIRNGFLNAASVGGIKLFAHELRDDVQAGEPIIVGTKWAFKECSLVDLPANREAFKVQLFDANDNAINLSDLTNQLKIDLKNKGMKKANITLSPLVIGALALSDNTTDEAVQQGIEKALQEREQLRMAQESSKAALAKLETELADVKAKGLEAEVKAIVDKAVEEKRMSLQTATQMAKAFAGNPKGLSDLVATMQPYQSVVGALNIGAGLPKELSDKTWDELHAADLLPRLKRDFPDKYQAMFNEKYRSETL